VRGADGRREQPPIFGAPRLPAKDRGWAADSKTPTRPYTRRQIVELAQLGIDVAGWPEHLIDGIHRAAMLDQPTVADAAQRMAALVDDTNDDYEGETVPSDPDREATFAEMIAAAEAEIAAEEEPKPFGVVDLNHWHDEPGVGARKRFPTWRGKGAYPTAVRKVKARGKKGLVTVEYGPTSTSVFKRHGFDQAEARRAAEAVFKRHGKTFEALSEEFTRRGRPRIHMNDAEKMRAYRRRKR
jgi:hypothetical protein